MVFVRTGNDAVEQSDVTFVEIDERTAVNGRFVTFDSAAQNPDRPAVINGESPADCRVIVLNIAVIKTAF